MSAPARDDAGTRAAVARADEERPCVDLQRLQTFQVLAETLHFRHAAERLGITQSAVSQQIAALERDLGAPLFERIGRRVYLTPAGEALAGEVAAVLSALARARDAVRAVGKGDAGRLRVGASTTPGIYLLPEVLGRFHHRDRQVTPAMRALVELLRARFSRPPP